MTVSLTLPLWGWVVSALALAFYLLYGGYLGYLTVYRAKRDGRLSRLGAVAKLLALVHVVTFGLLDVAFNLTVFTLLFFEFPREWTITARCQRHKDERGYRGRLARRLCERMLDPFQEGGHC